MDIDTSDHDTGLLLRRIRDMEDKIRRLESDRSQPLWQHLLKVFAGVAAIGSGAFWLLSTIDPAIFSKLPADFNRYAAWLAAVDAFASVAAEQ